MNQHTNLFGKYLITSANSIVHDPFRTFFLKTNMFEDIFNLKKPIDVQEDFLEFYLKWILSSDLNTFTGLDSFPYRYVSLGVTQSIDDFVLFCSQTNKNIKIFKGEYPYVREIINKEISYLDDQFPYKDDAVVISYPFSASGDEHPRWHELISHCNQNQIPVFVDCAFFGTCLDLSVSFDHPCINSVSFSPTKGLNCGFFRTGILFTKRKSKECSLDIQTSWHHGIHLHTAMALELMKEFGPDTIPLIYRDSQIKVCEYYNLLPSKTIHLGIGDSNWEYFSRDNIINRIGLKNPIYDLHNKGLDFLR
jgi:hypothetical protein